MFLTSGFVFAAVILCAAGNPVDSKKDESKVHLGTPPREDYPSLVSLGHVLDDGSGRISAGCGGTLITDQHILTAAHCYNASYSTFRAILGTRNKFFANTPGSLEVRFGKDAWTLNNYDPDDSYNHDNAVITLPDKVPLSVQIKTTRLARQVYHKNIRVVGWGKTECRPNSSPQETYLYAKGWIVEDNECRRYHNPLYDNQLCAKFVNEYGQSSGSDGGDSGGPLYATADDGKDVQIGIVSYSSKRYYQTEYQCTDTNIPMVYSKVAAAEAFIKSVAPEAIFV